MKKLDIKINAAQTEKKAWSVLDTEKKCPICDKEVLVSSNQAIAKRDKKFCSKECMLIDQRIKNASFFAQRPRPKP